MHPDGLEAPLWPLVCGPRLAAPQLCGKGCSPADTRSRALRLPGYRFVPGFARSCPSLGVPPLTVPLRLEGHFCLFPEGRREFGTV